MILLVDDEQEILTALSDQLRKTYRILSSCRPEEAIEPCVAGSAVNLASRIESYTFGGHLLISEATRAAVPSALVLEGEMTVEPKGVPHPVTLCDVVGIEGVRPRRLAGRDTETAVDVALPVELQIVEGLEFVRVEVHRLHV